MNQVWERFGYKTKIPGLVRASFWKKKLDWKNGSLKNNSFKIPTKNIKYKLKAFKKPKNTFLDMGPRHNLTFFWLFKNQTASTKLFSNFESANIAFKKIKILQWAPKQIKWMNDVLTYFQKFFACQFPILNFFKRPNTFQDSKI